MGLKHSLLQAFPYMHVIFCIKAWEASDVLNMLVNAIICEDLMKITQIIVEICMYMHICSYEEA